MTTLTLAALALALAVAVAAPGALRRRAARRAFKRAALIRASRLQNQGKQAAASAEYVRYLRGW